MDATDYDTESYNLPSINIVFSEEEEESSKPQVDSLTWYALPSLLAKDVITSCHHLNGERSEQQRIHTLSMRKTWFLSICLYLTVLLKRLTPKIWVTDKILSKYSTETKETTLLNTSSLPIS